MTAPLISINILSIYRKPPKTGPRLPLPERLAHCTPDTLKAAFAIRDDLRSEGGDLILSDLFRTHEMQLRAHLDFVEGRKAAFSPPPGGSLHESGRGWDLDLEALNVKLKRFWEIAAAHKVSPIISTPNSSLKEAWHFECRGSHAKVREYYLAGKANNFKKPYEAMAASSILAIGVQVDRFGNHQREAAIQAALIRLGHNPGNIDGGIGTKTRGALAEAGLEFVDAATTLAALEEQLKQTFPEEFDVVLPHGMPVNPASEDFEVEPPPHLVQ